MYSEPYKIFSILHRPTS